MMVNNSLSSLLVIFSLCSICFSCSFIQKKQTKAYGVTYYVDSENGNDLHSGMSENTAWKTLEKLGSVNLAPGNRILFKRGTEYFGCLTVNSSGTSDDPILISDYGDNKLQAPSFTNVTFDPVNKQYGNCIRLKGSYIIVENLYFHNTVAELPENAGGFLTMWELGALYIDKNAQHCTIKNNEFFDCGVGIKSYGQYAKIENNYIHDCNRVLKKWNWGPIGIWLGADYQEVCYNKIINYRAENPEINWGRDGYGGGADGSAIEIDDARNEKLNIHIHHNYSRDCQGFLEVTWTDVAQHPDYLDFKIHHNVSDDYQQFIALWQGAGCFIENNTIIRRKVNENEWGVFNITQHNSRNIIRNNIVITENDVVIFNLGKNGNAQPNNIIENNIYWAVTGKLNIGLEGPGKGAIISDPMLLNYSRGLEANDFSLSENSCAIDAGLNTEYHIDFNGTEIPQGNNPDIGAFEFQN